MGRDIAQTVAALQDAGEAFVVATVVRTVSVTAAKAGAKAVIRSDGVISEGWIGGGCARGAVLRAAREALADGQPRLISVSPDDVLAAQGVAAGQVRDGVQFARNMCPSKGTMDVFVEPMIPKPEVVVCGISPVALALLALAPQFGFAVAGSAASADLGEFPDTTRSFADHAIPFSNADRYVVVATQGRGDEVALRAALTTPATYRAFVGSRAKTAALAVKLADLPPDALAGLHAPAGLDLGAITPEEIALSILAQMVVHRRCGQRAGKVP
jgi:xanthine dehydrogenase accessory factor